MKPLIAAMLLGAMALPAAVHAQPARSPSAGAEDTSPFVEQAERKAAIKSGDKAAIAKATADENAAFARWRREHPAAAAVTPRSKAASEARAHDDTSPFTEQAERNAALKSGDKVAVAKATADENAAFAKWRHEHPAAAAVTPQSKAAHQAKLRAMRRHHNG